MEPPDFHFLPQQNYDCVCCGKSCSAFGVAVEPAAAERIRAAGPELRVLQDHGLSAFQDEQGELRLNSVDGRCVLLDQQNLCSLHSQFGFESKPDACRLFPLVLVSSQKGIRVSTSFFCTAVQQNLGSPLNEQRSAAQKLYLQGLTSHAKQRPVALWPRKRLSWEAYELLHETLEKSLDEGLPSLARRAWSAVHQLRVGPPTVTPEALQKAFDSAQPLSQAAQEQLDVKALCCLAALEGTSKEHEASLILDLCHGNPIELPKREFSGSAAEVGALMQRLEPQLKEPLFRYVRALLFRLGLGWTGSVHRGLMAFTFLDTVLSFYVAVSMLKHGRDEVAPEDIAAGYDRVEGDLGLHFRPPMAHFLKEWAEEFLEFLDKEEQQEC